MMVKKVMSLKVGSFIISYTSVSLSASLTNIEKHLRNKITVLRYESDFVCTEGRRKKTDKGNFPTRGNFNPEVTNVGHFVYFESFFCQRQEGNTQDLTHVNTKNIVNCWGNPRITMV